MSETNIPDSLPDWIKQHIETYLADGEAGHNWDARVIGAEGVFSTLLLTTKGRKSGHQFTCPLIYRPVDGGGFCVIASKGGAPTHPNWHLNLKANPEVELKLFNEEFKVVARVVEGDERAQLWDLLVDYYPTFTDYQVLTERQFPVVVFDPV